MLSAYSSQHLRRMRQKYENNTFFYKQHFYKQRQTEIGKKSSKV